MALVINQRRKCSNPARAEGSHWEKILMIWRKRAEFNEYIQFGCGPCAPSSWRNFDAGPAFWLQRHVRFLKPLLVRKGFPDYPPNIEYGDVIRGLPLARGSARAVYCSHVLEHLTLEEFRTAIGNVYRYLKPGGTFRLVVPDLEYMAKCYLSDTSAGAASHFMEATYLGEKCRQRGLTAMPKALFGRSKHFWMWDYKGIGVELAAAGFVGIRRAQFGDCADPYFKKVEDPGRWRNCLGVECTAAEVSASCVVPYTQQGTL